MSKTPNCAYQECPRFSFCCCNNCPLSLIKYESLPNDHTPKCSLAKTIRHRLGKKWNLPTQGLTSREFLARQRWNSLTESEKQQKIAKINEIRLSKNQDHINTPKENIKSEKPILNEENPLFDTEKNQSGNGVRLE